MAKKSTKTAHVLNLISKPTETKDNTTQEPQQQETVTASPPISSPLLSSLKETAKNAALSDKIKDNLLAELLEEEASVSESQPENNITASPEAMTSPENITSETMTPVPEPEEPKTENSYSTIQTIPEVKEEITPTPPIDTIVQPSAPTLDIDTPDCTVEQAEDIFYFVNVCEMLIKEKAVEYLKKFDVCTCSRCVADTIALTLSNLTPKYIVTDEPDVIPFLSYYDSKFNNTIMTELTKSCLLVDANPRHKPKTD